MRVLVSRREAAGTRTGPWHSDFHSTDEGEPLVVPGVVCWSTALRHACGCGRMFVGWRSGRAATVAVVEEWRAEDVAAEMDGVEPELVREAVGLWSCIDDLPPGATLRMQAYPD
jgi:hypothetical protein